MRLSSGAVALGEKFVRQKIMRSRRTRIDLQGCLEFGDGFLWLLQRDISLAQVAMCIGIVGFHAYGLEIPFRGLLLFTFVFQGRAKIVAGNEILLSHRDR